MGGLLGKVAGGLGRKAGGAATGMAFSFATTYALAHLAKRYYAGGRQMTTATLKQTFDGLKEPAARLQSQYAPQIQDQARTLDASSVRAWSWICGAYWLCSRAAGSFRPSNVCLSVAVVIWRPPA